MPSAAAATAKSLQSCLTLCDPTDGSLPGSPVPGIIQARTLEWVAISFSSAWQWKGSRSVGSDSSQPHGLQPTRLLHPWDFPGKSTGVECHCLKKMYPVLFPSLCSLWNFHISHSQICIPLIFSVLRVVLSCFSHVWLFVTPWTVAMPSSRGSSPPRDPAGISSVSCISRQVLYH